MAFYFKKQTGNDDWYFAFYFEKQTDNDWYVQYVLDALIKGHYHLVGQSSCDILENEIEKRIIDTITTLQSSTCLGTCTKTNTLG